MQNGNDYTFVCSKIPFAVSCSSHLPHEEYNLIDLDLVNKMKIPLQKIKVQKFSILGQSFRSVGFVSQTIQCVRQGKISGNIHLTARVVRDLYKELDVDSIASAKTYTRLVGKKPSKPPEVSMDLDDDYEEEEEEEDTAAEDTETSEVKTAAASKENADCPDNDRVGEVDIDNDGAGEVNIGDIVWNWGYKDVPTVDELYPDDTPEDNARWLNELHQTSPPRPFIGNKKYRRKSNICLEDEQRNEEVFCKLCFTTGQPLSTVHSHHTLHISCPTMTDDEKEKVYGPNWVARMYGYPT